MTLIIYKCQEKIIYFNNIAINLLLLTNFSHFIKLKVVLRCGIKNEQCKSMDYLFGQNRCK